MSAARVVSTRTFHPSTDRSDATIPTPTSGSIIQDELDACARLIRRKAVSDAERLVFMQQLGLTVTA